MWNRWRKLLQPPTAKQTVGIPASAPDLLQFRHCHAAPHTRNCSTSHQPSFPSPHHWGGVEAEEERQEKKQQEQQRHLHSQSYSQDSLSNCTVKIRNIERNPYRVTRSAACICLARPFPCRQSILQRSIICNLEHFQETIQALPIILPRHQEVRRACCSCDICMPTTPQQSERPTQFQKWCHAGCYWHAGVNYNGGLHLCTSWTGQSACVIAPPPSLTRHFRLWTATRNLFWTLAGGPLDRSTCEVSRWDLPVLPAHDCGSLGESLS